MDDKIENIAIDQIDAPVVPMRTGMDAEKLEELAASIKAQGLIQPITLRRAGARYEIIAGHRRTTAARMAGLVFIPAIVRALDDAKADEMRVHENLFREDVNPVDEARYIRKMIDSHNVEPEQLARMTGKSESYLLARYDLLNYPKYLLDEVEAERIGLTAAQWLMKITDENVRSEYARFAALGGITAKRAQAWFTSWEAGQLPRDPTQYSSPTQGTDVEPIPITMPCVLCNVAEDIQHMEMHYAHRDCVQAARKMHRENSTEIASAGQATGQDVTGGPPVSP